MRQVRERKTVGKSAVDVVDDIDGVLSYAEINALWTSRFSVTVLHKTGPWRFHRYVPGDPLDCVFDLTVEASSAKAATEVVFAIANSYPEELRCDPRYVGEVAAYRAAGRRSLSVGDVLLIRDDADTQMAWACAWTGFVPLSFIPTCRPSS